MNKWVENLLKSDVKKPMPILSYPSVQLMGIGVDGLIASSETLSEGMKLVAQRTGAAASCSMMDLSVEAEAFGSQVRFSGGEIPTVIGSIIKTEEDAEELLVPGTGKGRIAVYIEAIGKAAEKITDRPVFSGVIGPLSLAGRLIGVTDTMMDFYEAPGKVHAALEKATEFITKYTEAYKAAGADGVVMAEPLAGLLSPALCDEFSTPYVKKTADAVGDDDFVFIYHNCGNSAADIIDSILKTGASAYHFGNAVSMETILERMPQDVIVMGNIDPAGEFKNGTPESVRAATLDLLDRCGGHKNFVISSGCDIPPSSSWDNIDAFFAAVKEFYSR
jgi:uroporphyrinogen decarboxylase